MDWSGIVIALLGMLLGSGGLITFFVSRHDSKKDKLDAIVEMLDAMNGRIDQMNNRIDAHVDNYKHDSAVQKRVQILNFADDLRHGIPRSKDAYNQALDDITEYNRYCKEHPRFKNHLTAAAEEYIKNSYDEHYMKNDFIA